MRSALAGLFLSAILAFPAWASTGSIKVVWQPIWLADADGPLISAVTYVSDYMGQPGDVVRATVAPNAVMENGKPLSSNAAESWRLTLEVQEFEWNRVPDTLQVTLRVPSDTTRLERHTREVVASTAQCILFNTLAVSPDPPHFVHLKIDGSKRWKYLEGIHSLKNVRTPSRPMNLNGGKLQE